MDSKHRIEVPLRSGGKKMRKRRELDALIAHSITKRGGSRRVAGPTHSQDKLLSGSTDDPEDYAWTNVTMGRRQSRKYYYHRMCTPILFVCGTALLVGMMYWLYFDLRQELYDYRQKIEEVSATSKNLPDTLQKWHETSSFLIRNQSTILSRIGDLQKTIENLQMNLSRLGTKFEAQQNYAKDEKLVADFGAKIEAVATDIESVKDHYNTFSNMQKSLDAEIEKIKLNFINLTQTRTVSMPTNLSEEINRVKTNLLNNFKNLESDVLITNDTLSQKTKMLSDELATHKLKLDDLLERSENITSHVTTISNILPEFRQKIVGFDVALNKAEKEVSLTKNAYITLETSVKNLANICKNKSAEYLDSHQQSAMNGLNNSQPTTGSTSRPAELPQVENVIIETLTTEPSSSQKLLNSN